MQGSGTRMVRCYLRAGKSRDLAIRHRLETDVRNGTSASEICRRALAQYYGLSEKRPTPRADGDIVGAIATLSAELEQLRAEVRQMHSALRETMQWVLQLGQ